MVGNLIADDGENTMNNTTWRSAREYAIEHAMMLSARGVHKQNANRLLEPFFKMRIILTGTEFDNFFKLRDHKDAQPEIRELAQYMKECMEKSTPSLLKEGEYHVPFGDNSTDLRIAVARCARISYNPPDLQHMDPDRDIEIFNRLVNSTPIHASPLEHIARVPNPEDLKYMGVEWKDNKVVFGKYFSNLVGWIQLRKIYENGESFR
jgi:hypothetical protein